jgi:hypothetical protein
MDKDRQKKILLLRVLVLGSTLLIFAAWIFNLRGELKSAKQQPAGKSGAEVSDLKKEFSDALDKVNQQITELKKAQELAVVATSTSISSSSLPTLIPTPIISSSTVVASTSIIIDKGKETSNCPAYIDCMPTVGAARPCIIPPGCESKTIIAY